MSTEQSLIEALADKLHVRIEYIAGSLSASASYSAQALQLGKWKPGIESAQYWIALHELGHIANKHRGGTQFLLLFGPPGETLRVEAEAWAWALKNAELPLDEQGRAVIAYSMASYFSTDPVTKAPQVVRDVAEAAGRNAKPSLMVGVDRVAGEPAPSVLDQMWHKDYDLALAA